MNKDKLSRDEAILRTEREHLAWLVAQLRSGAAIEERIVNAGQDGRRFVGNLDSTDTANWQSLRSTEKQAARNRDELIALADQPYFRRIDVDDLYASGPVSRETYYVGRKPIRIDTELVVISWQTAVAMWAAGADLDDVDDDNGYRLKLRRELRIRSGNVLEKYYDEVVEAYDEDGRIVDPYLLEILTDERRTHAVTDIVRTIQANQMKIITQPLDQSFVVQGCAGSGKTMILLHRLSYLLFHNASRDWDRTLIITPNNGYMRQLDALFHELELDGLAHATLGEFYQVLIAACSQAPMRREPVVPEASLDPALLAEIYSAGFQRQVLTACRRTWDDCVIRALEVYEELASERVPFPDDAPPVEYGKQAADLWQAYANQLRAALAADRAAPGKIKKEIDEWNAQLEKIPEQLEAAEKKLLESREEVLGWVSYPTTKKYRQDAAVNRLPDLDLASLLRQDLRDIRSAVEADRLIPDKIADRLSSAECLEEYNKAYRTRESLHARATIMQKRIDTLRQQPLPKQLTKLEREQIQDLYRSVQAISAASMMEFVRQQLRSAYEAHGVSFEQHAMRHQLYVELFFAADYYGAPSIRQNDLYIDEAQDINLSEYRLLRQLLGRDSVFSLFGDLHQRSPQQLGMPSWDPLITELSLEQHTLSENYRNTAEITDFCNKRFDLAMTPIGISGSEPEEVSWEAGLAWLAHQHAQSAAERCAVVAPVERLAQIRSALSGKETPELYSWGQLEVGRIAVVALAECRGLEFDHVLAVLDPADRNYNYVACTRALHTLKITQGPDGAEQAGAAGR